MPKNGEFCSPDVDIRLHPIDETNKPVSHSRLINMVTENGGKGIVMMVGVQSNQLPRATDIARPFVRKGIPVIIGGFHVSGVMAMFDKLSDKLESAMNAGIHLFAGEAEIGRLDRVIRDAFDGRMAPIYNYLGQLPDLEGEPPPYLLLEETYDSYDRYTTFDLGRGCPNGCSFCTVINVNGRKSRARSADDLEAIIRRNQEGTTQCYFITDDNFSRYRNWLQLLDRLILIREDEGIETRLTIQTEW